MIALASSSSLVVVLPVDQLKLSIPLSTGSTRSEKNRFFCARTCKNHDMNIKKAVSQVMLCDM